MATESLKSLKEHSSEPVDKMLERYEDRASRGLIEKKEMERTFGLVDKALKGMKGRLDDPDFFKNLSQADLAELSNAWLAWSNPKFFPDAAERKQLETVLIAPSSNKKAERARVYARQIWRTEITQAVVEKLKKDERSDPEKSNVVEAIMASQKVKSGESSPADALRVSMHLDGAINSKAVRETLASEMEASQYKDMNALGGLAKELKGRTVSDFRVTVGGELLSVPENMREALQLKNVVFHWEEGRIYAQMKNGCEGNLVIIDISKGEAPLVGPDPVPPVVPTDPNTPPVDPNLVPPQPEDGLRGEGLYLRSTTRRGDLIPSNEQSNQEVDVALTSKHLLEQYDSLGIEPFLLGMEALSPTQQQAVLDNIFAEIGERDPARAQRLLSEIMANTSHVLRDNVLTKLDENVAAAPNADTADFWKLQKAFFEGKHENGDPLQVEEMVAMLDEVDPANLDPDLQDMFKINKSTVEFLVKRPLALDMVGTALSVAKSTFDEGDHGDLADLRAKPRSEIADVLNNRGWTLFDTSADQTYLDTDEEVYMSSMHVMEAIRLAIKYAYPQDIASGVEIENPVEYYYQQIKSGALTQVLVPPLNPGETPEQIDDPLYAAPVSMPAAGGVIDFNTFFVDRAKEIELYDQYDQGNESFGEHAMWNGYEGSAGAFMGEETGSVEGFVMSEGKGMIAGSKDMMTGNLFEKNGKVGGVEKLQLQKIYTLKQLGRYEEARDLCYAILQTRLDTEKPLTQVDIDQRTTDLSKNWLTKISAQVRLDLEAQGITSDAQVTSIPCLNGPGTYTSLNTYITEVATAFLQNKARIELESEVGEQIFNREGVAPAGYTDFEKQAFAYLADLSGYGYGHVADEKGDVASDISKAATELIVFEVATAGMGSFVAGVGGLARAGSIGSRAFGLARVLRVTDAAFAAGRGLRTAAGIARPLGTAERFLTAETGAAALARNVTHAAGMVEFQHLAHGELGPDSIGQAAYEIGSTAFLLGALGKFQQFSRAETVGARRVAAARAAGAPLPSAWTNPLARASEAIGRTRNGLTGVRAAGATGLEISAEIVAFHELNQAMLGGIGLYNQAAEGTMFAGLSPMTTTELEANSEPEAWKSWAHDAGVLLVLRGAGSVGSREGGGFRPETPRPEGEGTGPRPGEGPRPDGEGAGPRPGEGPQPTEPVRPAESRARRMLNRMRDLVRQGRETLRRTEREADRARDDAVRAERAREEARLELERAQALRDRLLNDADATARRAAEERVTELTRAYEVRAEAAHQARQTQLEAVRAQAEAAQRAAEAARDEASAAQRASETAREGAETAREGAETAREGAETARDEAVRRVEEGPRQTEGGPDGTRVSQGPGDGPGYIRRTEGESEGAAEARRRAEKHDWEAGKARERAQKHDWATGEARFRAEQHDLAAGRARAEAEAHLAEARALRDEALAIRDLMRAESGTNLDAIRVARERAETAARTADQASRDAEAALRRTQDSDWFAGEARGRVEAGSREGAEPARETTPVRAEAPEPVARTADGHAELSSIELATGRTVRIRLENGLVVEGPVREVYNPPEGTPNQSFKVEYRDPISGSSREYVAWKSQITTAPLTARRRTEL